MVSHVTRQHQAHGRPAAPYRYVSEYEQFIDGYLADHPDIPVDQQRGWYRL